ncbi:MAG: DUF3619 family protein [Burkholderiales bacterium]
MNEREFGRKIVQALDGGLNLPAEALARLKVARARAVDAQRHVEPSLALTFIDAISAHLAGPTQWLTHVLLPVLLLIGGMIGLNYWQDSQQRALVAADTAEVDTRLLRGDLPIDAYLDSGFQAWLKRSSE